MLKICFFLCFCFCCISVPACTVKTVFNHGTGSQAFFSFVPAAYTHEPPVIDVNFDLNISINGSDWHGYADYTVVNGEGQWELTYHWNGNVKKCRTVVYKQVPNTTSFLDSNQHGSSTSN